MAAWVQIVVPGDTLAAGHDGAVHVWDPQRARHCALYLRQAPLAVGLALPPFPSARTWTWDSGLHYFRGGSAEALRLAWLPERLAILRMSGPASPLGAAGASR